jgi:hypothetical protein
VIERRGCCSSALRRRAHGANRTGASSSAIAAVARGTSRWRAASNRIANLATSTHVRDGLRLDDAGKMKEEGFVGAKRLLR